MTRWAEVAGDPALHEFWTQWRVGVLGTVRPDGSPHAVAVGATVDFAAGIARVITGRGSRKVANVRAEGPDGVLVTLTEVDGGRWCSLRGRAVVREEPEPVADAERRYAERYRVPRPNPERVVIEIQVSDVLGRW